MDLVFSHSYYVCHPKEWDAICSGRGSWEGRAGILEWHIQFTSNFQEFNKNFGILAKLDKLNKDLSYFVHGIPAIGLPMTLSLDRAELDKVNVAPVIELAERADNGLNSFLIGVFHGLLPTLSATEYKLVLSGMSKGKLAGCGITLPYL